MKPTFRTGKEIWLPKKHLNPARTVRISRDVAEDLRNATREILAVDTTTVLVSLKNVPQSRTLVSHHISGIYQSGRPTLSS